MECVICLEEIKIIDNRHTLECKHCFHENCYNELIRHEYSKCPLCRKDIPIPVFIMLKKKCQMCGIICIGCLLVCVRFATTVFMIAMIPYLIYSMFFYPS